MRPETGRALLAATAPATAASGSLGLLDRIATSRGLRLPPSTGPAVEAAGFGPRAWPESGGERRRIDRRDGLKPVSLSGVALLAAHGGAGVSCLLRAGVDAAGGHDADRRWPVAGSVLLVARTSTYGLERASDLARQHTADSARHFGTAGADGADVRLVGLVLVADAPGRLPARIAGLADLVSGGFSRCWQVPWLPQWRLASAGEPLPVHPEVARLIRDLHLCTDHPVTTPAAPHRQ
jgi:hypothetical protein